MVCLVVIVTTLMVLPIETPSLGWVALLLSFLLSSFFILFESLFATVLTFFLPLLMVLTI